MTPAEEAFSKETIAAVAEAFARVSLRHQGIGISVGCNAALSSFAFTASELGLTEQWRTALAAHLALACVGPDQAHVLIESAIRAVKEAKGEGDRSEEGGTVAKC